MGPQCFRRKDSERSICGVHDVPLVQRHSHDDPKMTFLGDFEFFVCPASDKVVSDECLIGDIRSQLFIS
jgi:hypothetical protein